MLIKIKSLADSCLLTINKVINIHPALQTRILTSIVIILLLWFLQKIVFKLSSRYLSNIQAKYRLKKTLKYTSLFIGVLLIGRVWFEGVQSISTFLGLFTAGVALALRDPILNVAGWFFILWHAPFEVGDRIQMGKSSGDVIDVRLFQFTVLEVGNWVEADQSTGRIIHIPNGKIFNDYLFNYSKGFQYIWNEIGITVTFESDWKKAKKQLTEIVNKHAKHLSGEAAKGVKKAARKYMIVYKTLTPTVYTTVEDNGVKFTLRYLCKPRRRRFTANNIWEDVLDSFNKSDDIDFAYPTQRFYDNSRESKNINS
jgi:small-conductance mechanosensitive channel